MKKFSIDDDQWEVNPKIVMNLTRKGLIHWQTLTLSVIHIFQNSSSREKEMVYQGEQVKSLADDENFDLEKQNRLTPSL